MRSLDTVYQVDGQPMLAPDAGVSLSWNDVDSDAAGRDAGGYLHRAVLRQGLRTWGFTYSYLSREELAYLQSLFAGKPTFTFTCEEGPVKAYCAKREATLYSRTKGIYNGLRFTVIEC